MKARTMQQFPCIHYVGILHHKKSEILVQAVFFTVLQIRMQKERFKKPLLHGPWKYIFRGHRRYDSSSETYLASEMAEDERRKERGER